MMNPRQKYSSLTVRNRSWRRAVERLDEALEKISTWDNSAKIAAMRRAYFADVDKLEEVNIPKRKL